MCVGERERLVLVVGHEDRGGHGLGEHMRDIAAKLFPERRVERAERLVEQHQRRADRERAGERDALLLAAGELVRVAVGVPVEADHLEQFADDAPDRIGAHRSRCLHGP